MQRILIRHTAGARSNQIDEFQSGSFKQIIAGRDEAAAVRFDPERDDLVSREHLKIAPDPSAPGVFVVTDLESRNGTFVNRQRINSPTRIHHFDLVQLGPGGPEFRFELDPAPSSAARLTRVADSGGIGISARPTRESSVPAPAASRPVGRATVERMLDDSFGRVKKESNKSLWVGLAAVVMTACVGIGIYSFMHHSAMEIARQSQEEQTLLLKMAQVVNQQPINDADVKQRIDSLNAELGKVIAQNQALRRSIALNASTPKAAGETNDPARQYAAGFSKAQNLYMSGQYEQALIQCQELSDIDSSRFETYLIAGMSDDGLGQRDQAHKMYENAIALAPDDQKPAVEQKVNQLESSLNSPATEQQ